MSEKIKYTCTYCGWKTSIIEEWADMQPKRCMNKKCNTSFVKNPEALETTMPVKAEAQVPRLKKSKRTENETD